VVGAFIKVTGFIDRLANSKVENQNRKINDLSPDNKITPVRVSYL